MLSTKLNALSPIIDRLAGSSTRKKCTRFDVEEVRNFFDKTENILHVLHEDFTLFVLYVFRLPQLNEYLEHFKMNRRHYACAYGSLIKYGNDPFIKTLYEIYIYENMTIDKDFIDKIEGVHIEDSNFVNGLEPIRRSSMIYIPCLTYNYLKTGEIWSMRVDDITLGILDDIAQNTVNGKIDPNVNLRKVTIPNVGIYTRTIDEDTLNKIKLYLEKYPIKSKLIYENDLPDLLSRFRYENNIVELLRIYDKSGFINCLKEFHKQPDSNYCADIDDIRSHFDESVLGLYANHVGEALLCNEIRNEDKTRYKEFLLGDIKITEEQFEQLKSYESIVIERYTLYGKTSYFHIIENKVYIENLYYNYYLYGDIYHEDDNRSNPLFKAINDIKKIKWLGDEGYLNPNDMSNIMLSKDLSKYSAYLHFIGVERERKTYFIKRNDYDKFKQYMNASVIQEQDKISSLHQGCYFIQCEADKDLQKYKIGRGDNVLKRINTERSYQNCRVISINCVNDCVACERKIIITFDKLFEKIKNDDKGHYGNETYRIKDSEFRFAKRLFDSICDEFIALDKMN